MNASLAARTERAASTKCRDPAQPQTDESCSLRLARASGKLNAPTITSVDSHSSCHSASMNGFADHGLDDSAFGENKAISAVKAFDAFPKTKPSYTQKTNTGGVWTVVLICASLWLATTELKRWWYGQTTHEFSVEQGVGHDLQINLDVVVAMKCEDLHVNVQDASGDRILAGQALNKNPTTWMQWGSDRKMHALGASKQERLDLSGYPGFGEFKEYQEEDVHDYLGAARRSKKFSKTPRLPRGTEADSCRLYGSMHGNKVQGDFHITARGHGYNEFGTHLDHGSRYKPEPLTMHHPFQRASLRRGVNGLTRHNSLQLLPPHQRTLLRPLLSLPHQPAR